MKPCDNCINKVRFGGEEWCIIFKCVIDDVDWDECEFKRTGTPDPLL